MFSFRFDEISARFILSASLKLEMILFQSY